MTTSPPPGWYPDPANPHASVRLWDQSGWTAHVRPAPRRLRDVTALLRAAWQVTVARGLMMVALSATAWAAWAAVAFAALAWTVDLPAVTALVRDITADTDSQQASVDALLAGGWRRAGLPGLLAAGAIAAGGYVAAAAIANTAVTFQAYHYLEHGQRRGFAESFRHAGARSAPAMAFLAFWYTVTLLVAVVLPFSVWLLAVQSGSVSVLPAVALLAGGVLAGAAVVLWLYARWSLAGYAVALSLHPWEALRTSARITRGSRWLVLGRLILIGLAVSFAVSTAIGPVNGAAGLVPPSVVLIVLLLASRVVSSAVSGTLIGAASTSMYLDLGGDRYDDGGAAGTPVVPRAVSQDTARDRTGPLERGF